MENQENVVVETNNKKGLGLVTKCGLAILGGAAAAFGIKKLINYIGSKKQTEEIESSETEEENEVAE